MTWEKTIMLDATKRQFIYIKKQPDDNLRGFREEEALSAQAEISYKAGIKEAVDWTEENIHPGFHSGKEADKFMIKWRAKLEEWGIED